MVLPQNGEKNAPMRHQVSPNKTPSARMRFHTNPPLFQSTVVTLYNTAAKLLLNTPVTALSHRRNRLFPAGSFTASG